MRHYLFYCSITILALILSIFVGFKFYRKTAETDAVKNYSQNPVAQKQPDEFTFQKIFAVEKTDSNKKFTCNEKPIAFILNELKKDSEDKDFITNFIVEKHIENCDELFEIEKETDLNDDGIKEQIIRAKNSPKGMFYCGATGNCSTWILQRARNDYKIILDAGSIESVEIKDEVRNDFRSLVTRGNSGAMNHYLGTFEFNGKNYQASKCVEEVTATGGEKSFISRKVSDCE